MDCATVCLAIYCLTWVGIGVGAWVGAASWEHKCPKCGKALMTPFDLPMLSKSPLEHECTVKPIE